MLIIWWRPCRLRAAMQKMVELEQTILCFDIEFKQDGAELGQAQLKLGFEFTFILCRFGLFRYDLVGLVR